MEPKVHPGAIGEYSDGTKIPDGSPNFSLRRRLADI